MRAITQRRTLACPAGALALLISWAAAAQEPAFIKVHDHRGPQLAARDGARSPAQRAAEASKRLTAIVDEELPGAVLLELFRDHARLKVGEREVLRLLPADAEQAGVPLNQYAPRVQAELTEFLATERHRASLQHGVLRASLIVFFAVLGYLLLRLFLRAVKRLEERLLRNQGDLPPDLRRLARGPWRNFAVMALDGARLVAVLATFFVVLLVSLSLFDSTRPWRDRLAAGAAEPFSSFVHRLSGAVPNLLLLLLLVLVLRGGWQAVTLAFERAAAAPPSEGGLPPDRVAAFRLLARAGLALAAGLMFPLVLGSRGGVLVGLPLVVAAVCALAILPIGATAAAGAWSLWTRRYREGEWLRLRIGAREVTGQVAGTDFMHLKLHVREGGDVRLPHLALLFTPVVHLSAQPSLRVELPVELRQLDPAAALALIEMAARALAAEHGLAAPEVTIAELSPGLARFAVSLPGAAESLRNRLLIALAEAVSPAHRQAEADVQ